LEFRRVLFRSVRRQQTRSVWSPGFSRPNATNLECSLIATTDRLKPGLQTAWAAKKLHFLLNSPAQLDVSTSVRPFVVLNEGLCVKQGRPALNVTDVEHGA